MTDSSTYRYDVGLSYASEQHEYIELVHRQLASRGIRTFFDDKEEVELWGKDLHVRLSEVFQNECHYCVVFVSEDYARKRWPQEELASAFARAMEEKGEYVLPARFDDTPLPGLRSTIRYVDLRNKSAQQFADLIAAKIGKLTRDEYLPQSLDLLYGLLDVESDEDRKQETAGAARSFFNALRRMETNERKAVIGLLTYGCQGDMPDNMHINADLLRRVTGLTVVDLKDALAGLDSLGFTCTVVDDKTHATGLPGEALGSSDFFYLDWWDLRKNGADNGLQIAVEMVRGALEGLCEACGTERLERLDFSQLSKESATSELPELHE